MRIHCFEVRVSNHQHAALHTHLNHEWYFCLDSGCTQITDQTRFEMHPGDICLFPEGVPHYAYAHNANSSGAWVMNVEEEFLSSLHEGDRHARAVQDGLCAYGRTGQHLLPLTSAGRELARSALGKMVDETTAQKEGWQGVVKAELLGLLIGICRNWAGEKPLTDCLPQSGRRDRMQSVFAYIDNNYMNPLMIDDLLPLAHLSRSHFHAVFAAEAGCTFKEYLNRIRISQAERLLTESAIPISQIALGCGFSCLSHFYATFRRSCGCSPLRFRDGKGVGFISYIRT